MEQKNSFALKGNILWSRNPGTIETAAGGYLACIDGKSAGVFSQLPQDLTELPIIDYSPCL
ncbi:MAG: hypothetical protein LBH42_05510, partial [Treponema sp.]|nr:hypothetical protein [Treponema sp.]